MEFAEIKPPKFGIDGPPNPYPEEKQDGEGNFSNSDKDFSKASEFSPQQVKEFHYRSDADSSRNALHHTLGSGRNEASPGDHIHDGTTSKKLGNGLGLVLTGAKGGNVALTNLIAMLKTVMDFTDSTT